MKKKLNCILLIDDDEPTNFLNRMTVEQTGCTRHVAVAQSGQEALDFLMGHRPAGNTAGRPPPAPIFLANDKPPTDGWEIPCKKKQLPQAKNEFLLFVLSN